MKEWSLPRAEDRFPDHWAGRIVRRVSFLRLDLISRLSLISKQSSLLVLSFSRSVPEALTQ